MKKFLTRVFVSLSGFLMTPYAVLAEDLESPVSDKWKDLASILNSLSSWIRPLAIIFLLWLIVWGGFVRLRAAGNPEEEKKAYFIIRGAIIGFIIIVMAPLIVETIGLILGIELLRPNP